MPAAGCRSAARAVMRAPSTGSLLLVLSSHDLGAAATHNRCCVRTRWVMFVSPNGLAGDTANTAGPGGATPRRL